MSFLIDNQLPPALARLIQNELKANAIHVADIGLRDATDEEVWNTSIAPKHGVQCRNLYRKAINLPATFCPAAKWNPRLKTISVVPRREF